MSVVPYNTNNQIVFSDANDGILVVHDNDSNTIQVLLKVAPTSSTGTHTNHSSSNGPPPSCPNCGYDFGSRYQGNYSSSFPSSGRRNSGGSENLVDIRGIDPREFNNLFKSLPRTFMNHEYFKLLERLPYVPEYSVAPAVDDRFLFTQPVDIFNQGYFDRFFKKVPPGQLGSGARAIVYKVQHVLNDIPLGTYAVKRISVGGNFELLDHVLNEVLILYELSVKGANENNLIRYNHVWLEMGNLDDSLTFILGGEQSRQVPYVFILQQYCDGGHLELMIQGNFQVEAHLSEREKVLREKERRRNIRNAIPELPKRPWLNEVEIFKFFSDVSTGVAYLHKHGILHRDLKPSNCLLETKYTSQDYMLPPYTYHQYHKIVGGLPKVLVLDFGEGQFIAAMDVPEPNEYIRLGHHQYERLGNTGTLEFTAPELWLYADDPAQDHRKRFLNSFSYESDVYSLGLILCFLCVGSLPFTDIVIGFQTDPEQVRAEIITWYQQLTPQTFHRWFVRQVNDIHHQAPSGCLKAIELLIYAMLKGDGQRISAAEVMTQLELIKREYFLEDDTYDEAGDADYVTEDEKDEDSDVEELESYRRLQWLVVVPPLAAYVATLGALEWLTSAKLPKLVVLAGLALDLWRPLGHWRWPLYLAVALGALASIWCDII